MAGEVAVAAVTAGERRYSSPAFEGLSFRFAVRASDPVLGRYLEAVLAPLRSRKAASHHYSLVTARGGSVEVFLDDTMIARAGDRAEAAAWVLWHLNRAVVDASGEHILLHAGAVRAGDAGIIVPAPMSSGKTTLVAGLVQRGLGYMTDEVVALTADGSTLLPFPKALSVERGSLAVLFGSGGRPGPAPDLGGDQFHVVPDDLRPGSAAGPCAPAMVIAPRYRPGRPSTLVPMDGAEAVLELSTNAVNLDRHGGRGLRVLAAVAERCACYRLEVSDLDDACRLVAGALDALDAVGPLDTVAAIYAIDRLDALDALDAVRGAS
jgi:hypothetical protein